mmetsp:Transcript_26444/g.70168  ORF Transcript_26444/g.70168 Transcript_26444/m.70168 type:complete len:110 (+) Transcript_26444:919-1248(+)
MQVLPSVSTRREEDEEAGEEGAREGGQAEACNGTGVRPLDLAVRHDSCTVQIFATQGAQRRIQTRLRVPGRTRKGDPSPTHCWHGVYPQSSRSRNPGLLCSHQAPLSAS